MRILFGPEQDHSHIGLDEPGGYEWWYFDALSDDGQYALVVIFFLGTPMSPYYAKVVEAQNAGKTPPLPKDWCAVFISLHERIPAGDLRSNSPSGTAIATGRILRFAPEWRERAYAYNLYRVRPMKGGWFQNFPFRIRLGNSTLKANIPRAGDTHNWELSLREKGLFFDTITANLQFVTEGKQQDSVPEIGQKDDAHTWVCVAPHCRVEGTIQTPGDLLRDSPSGFLVNFRGEGYHDHNFGTLPFTGIKRWRWDRAFVRSRSDGSNISEETATALLYYLDKTETGNTENYSFLIPREGSIDVAEVATEEQPDKEMRAWQSSYGLRYKIRDTWRLPQNQRVQRTLDESSRLARGPFYFRSLSHIEWERDGRLWTGTGIGEVFVPERLCHPFYRWAMWARIRRRS